jgi:acyl carrier protein
MVGTIEDRVKDIVCERLGVNRALLHRDLAFQKDLGADSLELVEFVMALEEQFGITIPEDHTDRLRTLGDAIDYLEREQARP